MSSWSNNAIITKSKAIYGNFLKPDDYEKLVKIHSLSELVGYLKKQKNYEVILKDIQENTVHRGHLESLIRKNSFDHILRLIKIVYSNDVEFYELNVVQQENEIILAAIRTIISDEFEENKGKMPLFFNVHTQIDMNKLFKTTTYEEMLDSIKNTPYYALLKPYSAKSNEKIRYLDIEHALEEYYYDEAFRRIDKYYSGTTKKDLESIFQTRIELGNIIKIYRLKKFYKADPVTIKNVLIKKHTRISEKKMDEIIKLENPDAILKYLSASEFSRFQSDKDYVYVEYYAGRIRYELAKKFMYFSSDVPKVYTAFITLSEIEIENLTNIIEGIRYQVGEQEIKQMLIY